MSVAVEGSLVTLPWASRKEKPSWMRACFFRVTGEVGALVVIVVVLGAFVFFCSVLWGWKVGDEVLAVMMVVVVVMMGSDELGRTQVYIVLRIHL